MSTPEPPYEPTQYTYRPREAPGLGGHRKRPEPSPKRHAGWYVLTASLVSLAIVIILALALSGGSKPESTASAASTSVAVAAPSATPYAPADPSGVAACIKAWVKLNRDGVTAAVLAAPRSEASELVESAHPSDLENGAVCGTLSLADDTYATGQINARTGDDYKVGSAVKTGS